MREDEIKFDIGERQSKDRCDFLVILRGTRVGPGNYGFTGNGRSVLVEFLRFSLAANFGPVSLVFDVSNAGYRPLSIRFVASF